MMERTDLKDTLTVSIDKIAGFEILRWPVEVLPDWK